MCARSLGRLSFRRCGQYRRSCCINQLVSPRAAPSIKRLHGFSHDVTGDRPTISKDTQKAEHTLSVCSLKRTLKRCAPFFALSAQKDTGRADGQAHLNQYRTKRKVCSRPYTTQARLLQGVLSAIWPRVQLSGGRSLKINSHHAQPLSFQKMLSL